MIKTMDDSSHLICCYNRDAGSECPDNIRRTNMANMRGMYKKMLTIARTLPTNERQNIEKRIRKEFRKPSTENHSLEDLLKKAESALGYLKIIAPKQKSEKSVERFYYKDGERVGGPIEGTNSQVLNPPDREEAFRKHIKLTRRQYFMDRR